MNSGNTYRMRPDGSHAEYFTHGQVNPFGLAFDPLGNLYSCDCHSRPVYQLLRGAWYPSFGKPDDGLGLRPRDGDPRPRLDRASAASATTRPTSSPSLTAARSSSATSSPTGSTTTGSSGTARRPRGSSSPTSSGARTTGFARWTSSWAPTGRSTSPTSTTASSAITRCR